MRCVGRSRIVGRGSRLAEAPHIFISNYCSLLRDNRIRFFRRTSRFNSLCMNVNSSTACLRCGRHGPVFPRRRHLFVMGGVGTIGRTRVGRNDNIVSFVPALSVMRPSVFIIGTRNNDSTGHRLYRTENVRCVRLRHAPRRNLRTHDSDDLGTTLGRKTRSRISPSGKSKEKSNVPAELSLTNA